MTELELFIAGVLTGLILGMVIRFVILSTVKGRRSRKESFFG